MNEKWIVKEADSERVYDRCESLDEAEDAAHSLTVLYKKSFIIERRK